MRKYHRVIMIRNGIFVGLYRPAPEGIFRLWRVVNDDQYDRESTIHSTGVSIFCNEWYRIPASIQLTRSNLDTLDKMMGAGTDEVNRRILAFADTLTGRKGKWMRLSNEQRAILDHTVNRASG